MHDVCVCMHGRVGVLCCMVEMNWILGCILVVIVVEFVLEMKVERKLNEGGKLQVGRGNYSEESMMSLLCLIYQLCCCDLYNINEGYMG